MRIALLTDFGTRDPYVAAMRGVIASRTRSPLFDLTHEIAPFDVFEAAWFLRSAAPFWSLTIFVCVVDPGVGTARRILAMKDDDRIFLAPDNGLLTFVARNGVATRSLENEDLFLPGGSATFHGRDRFAPAAAALANGFPFEALGPAVDRIELLPYTEPSYGDPAVGTVVAIDRFGNLITDLEASRFDLSRIDVHVGSHTIGRSERTYGEAGAGPFVLAGSHGCLEVAVKDGSAAEALGVRRGATVEVRLR